MAPRSIPQPARAFLIEHYWPGATVSDFHRVVVDVAARISDAAMRGEPIRLLHSTFVPADEAVYWVVSAPSPDLVELAYAAAGVVFERLIEVVELDEAAHAGNARPKAR